ncbi:MAG: type II toxin-antitoxin system VapC family toxin [Actinomycetota bacterium]|nr:type II toxin-antitoxin system VapC family toxin [Actinomycetota bacterium]
MSVVVDASLVVALVVADERQAAVRALLEGWVDSGEDLHAPMVLAYEVANVLARLAFDGELETAAVGATWADLAALDIALHPFDLAQDGPTIAAITARLRRRHATDSTYILLAQQLTTVVFTLDGSLARNSAEVGLPVELVT